MKKKMKIKRDKTYKVNLLEYNLVMLIGRPKPKALIKPIRADGGLKVGQKGLRLIDVSYFYQFIYL